ncbi:MAG: hypothetical protein V1929_10965 [bacterium]
MTAPTIHLVYPDGPAISCPDAIGRNLRERLSESYPVRTYTWDDRSTVRPAHGDILIGHPHPNPCTVFRRSLHLPGWKRILMLCPYAHGDLRQVAMWDTVIPRCDAFLAITGRYWFETMPTSAFAHWYPRTVHMDLAVDRGDFPFIKQRFNPPGQRKFLYIGSKIWLKNTTYISELARRLPGTTFRWIGSGRGGIKGVESLGQRLFSDATTQRLVADHDFLISVGRSDANPATILESMSWGLIPVCTPQSGYVNYASIPNVPLDQPDTAAAVLQHLQQLSEHDLAAMQVANHRLLDEHFNWDRFNRQVVSAIESTARPALGVEPSMRKIRLRWSALTSPYAPWHPLNVARRTARTLLGPPRS